MMRLVCDLSDASGLLCITGGDLLARRLGPGGEYASVSSGQPMSDAARRPPSRARVLAKLGRRRRNMTRTEAVAIAVAIVIPWTPKRNRLAFGTKHWRSHDSSSSEVGTGNG